MRGGAGDKAVVFGILKYMDNARKQMDSVPILGENAHLAITYRGLLCDD